jgi:hypothetical protein
LPILQVVVHFDGSAKSQEVMKFVNDGWLAGPHFFSCNYSFNRLITHLYFPAHFDHLSWATINSFSFLFFCWFFHLKRTRATLKSSDWKKWSEEFNYFKWNCSKPKIHLHLYYMFACYKNIRISWLM